MNQLSNYVQLIGNLGQAPEIKELASGQKLLNCSLATNESYLDKAGNWQNQTQWHKLVIWGKMAEKMAQSLDKGDQILIRGKLEHRSYEDKDGVKRITSQVNVRNYMKMKQKAAVSA